MQDFRENSEVLLALLQGERPVFMANSTVRRFIERYERRVSAARLSQVDLIRENRRLVNHLINFSRNDRRNFEGHFYDYFHSSVYFETSIPLQREFREQLTDFLKERERDYRHFRRVLGR